MTDTKTNPVSFAEAEDRTQAIYQALGAASVCWKTPPTGEFDERQATAVAEGLLDRLAQLDKANAEADSFGWESKATYRLGVIGRDRLAAKAEGMSVAEIRAAIAAADRSVQEHERRAKLANIVAERLRLELAEAARG